MMMYRHEMNKIFRATLQKIEPKIKIIKYGRQYKYCYIDRIDEVVNYDNQSYKIFNLNSIIIDFLKTNLRKEFTTSEIADPDENKQTKINYAKQNERKLLRLYIEMK